MRTILTLYGLLLATSMLAQTNPRIKTRLNENWEFLKSEKIDANSVWTKLNLPHTWNVEDVMDDVPGYYRGIAWYRKNLFFDKKLSGKKIYLFFEGVNQVAEVFVNGKKAGEHIGGYSGFYISISEYVQVGKENELLVKVDNSHNENIPPLSADFTFYGGIYRDVWLVVENSIHFSNQKGVLISTPQVNQSRANIKVKTIVTNETRKARQLKISVRLIDKKNTVITKNVSVSVPIDKDLPVELPTFSITKPKLWSPDQPYLYTVVTEIKDATTNELLDRVSHPLGLRWFEFTASKGFFLNGKPCFLTGSSRHQDYKGLGNAVPDQLAIEDVRLIKKMGANFLRVAHYPQDPSILAACDSLGILASVEIPIVNEITETEQFFENCMQMQREMIFENYNHPSVIAWCYMNEVLLRSRYNNDKERQKKYFASITRLAISLDSLTRKEDPYRYTMMAHHGDYNKYNEARLIEIPMIVGWNLYSGWYGAKIEELPAFLDEFHRKHPGKIALVSEYGADADPRIRSLTPVRFDKSVEYSTNFHQYYMMEIRKRPFVAAAMIWNLADFNSETRTESMPHINNKGLLEWDRTPKDPYYFYQAILLQEPFIKILGRGTLDAVLDSSNQSPTRLIRVASNLPELELIMNGISMGKKKTVFGLCEWSIQFQEGLNNIEVNGDRNGKIYGEKIIVQSNNLKSNNRFNQLNILLGAQRFFLDRQKQWWIPDQIYREGGWGHEGGKCFKIANNNRLPYGTDKNILGTTDDPIYQTQQVGIKKYKLDVSTGEYELSLHFAELLGGTVKSIPYNLNDPERIEPNGKRIFNVYVNGKLFLDHFDISSNYGAATAVVKTLKVSVENNSGIEILFESIEGEAILNALQLKKIKSLGVGTVL